MDPDLMVIVLHRHLMLEVIFIIIVDTAVYLLLVIHDYESEK